MKMLAALAFVLVLGHVASGELGLCKDLQHLAGGSWDLNLTDFKKLKRDCLVDVPLFSLKELQGEPISVSLRHLSRLSGKVQEVTSSDENYAFDYLLFTQQWPYTACYVYSTSTSECRLPPKNNPYWTIHGIWPTNYTSHGPNNCDPSKTFNVKQVAPIEKKLEKLWADIKTYENYTTFWSHEWVKHGTCAMQLKPLHTELLYFKRALQWNQKYNMKKILKKINVVPDSQKGYNMTIVWQGLKQQLGTSPEITCAYDKSTKQHFIQEIRICFSKQLEIVDCQGTMQQLLGECPETRSLAIYPDTVPSTSQQHEEDTFF